MLLRSAPKLSLLCSKLCSDIYIMLSGNMKYNMYISCWLLHALSDTLTLCILYTYVIEFISSSLHLWYNNHCRFSKCFQNVKAFMKTVLCTISLPIMLVLCLMFLLSYYVKNYVVIIEWNLNRSHVPFLSS